MAGALVGCRSSIHSGRRRQEPSDPRRQGLQLDARAGRPGRFRPGPRSQIPYLPSFEMDENDEEKRGRRYVGHAPDAPDVPDFRGRPEMGHNAQ